MPFDANKIERAVPLAPLTTLGLGGPAAFFYTARAASDVTAALAWANGCGMRVMALGGGSNVVVADAGFDGLVMKIETHGIRALPWEGGGRENARELQVAAGEPWEDFVAHAAAEGLAGVECLAGIPGQVGATPIQNVGAYGQDVSQTITRVHVLERKTLTSRWFTAEELQFAYRDSWLRRNPDYGVVLEVVFRLRLGSRSEVRYGELSRALADLPPAPTPEAELARVRDTVIALRRKKSMVLDASDPNTRSAGSFFTNPIVEPERAAAVVRVALARGFVRDAAEVPRWPAESVGSRGQVKLAAAWLIEHAGFRRGHRRGNVGLSSAHALALVNHGGTAQELVAFAHLVRSEVRSTFGVELSPEPVFVGHTFA